MGEPEDPSELEFLGVQEEMHQFVIDTHIHRSIPERHLVAAVLDRAICDCLLTDQQVKVSSKRDNTEKVERRKARAFVFKSKKEDINDPFSFFWICHTLGYDPQEVRRYVASRMVEAMMLLLFCFLPAISHAQQFGLDTLGGAKYCDRILSSTRREFALGFFDDTFGSSFNCIESALRTGKANTVRVQLAWSDNHQFPPREFDRIAEKGGKYQGLIAKYPGAKIYLSGACEHNLGRQDAENLKRKVLAKCPSCEYVNVPWKGALIDGINEVHGSKSRVPGGRYFFSFDGESAVDSDVEAVKRKFSGAEIFFLWEPRFNGRWESNDNTPRPQRKGWPDGKLITSVARLSSPKGSVGPLPRNSIFKSHSENKGNGDSRAEKPVAIISEKTSEISLVTTNGKEVSKARYYGPFERQHRYYFPSWGYEIADKAKQLSGSELTYLRVKGKNHGPVNPAFRDGSFR